MRKSGLSNKHPEINENSSNNNPIDVQISCDKQKLKACLATYLGQPISKENLMKIKNSIEKCLASNRDSLYLVQIPEQKISDGRIVVLAMPAKIDQVSTSGNRWFSSQSILGTLGIQQGDIAKEENLFNTTSWINRNPFIHTNAVLSPGENAGDVNLEILSKDRFPIRFYAGADNTANRFSGTERFYAGVNIALGLKNLLTYQFTFGYDFPEFLSHYANWTSFLPWKHELVFYGGYATLHPEITDFDSKGSDVQGSMRYIIPFKPLYIPFQHQFLWGADYKKTDSSLFFLGALPDGSIQRALVNQKNTDLFQFYVSYQLENTWEKLKIHFQIENFFSIIKFLPNQKKSNYNSLRPGAEITYLYSRLGFGTTYRLPRNFTFSSLLRGQVSTGALLPSEQFGLGGYDTVRGYQERVFLADNAVIGNLEIRTPPISFSRKKIDELYFLAFVDAAYGYNWKASPAFPKDAWLMGVGPGIRYQISPYFSARLDYGFRIHNTQFGNDQIGRVHFGLTLSY